MNWMRVLRVVYLVLLTAAATFLVASRVGRDR